MSLVAAGPAVLSAAAPVAAGAAGAGAATAGGAGALATVMQFLGSDAGGAAVQGGIGLLGQSLQRDAARDMLDESFAQYMQSLPIEAGLSAMTRPFTPQTAIPASFAQQAIGLQPNTAANLIRY